MFLSYCGTQVRKALFRLSGEEEEELLPSYLEACIQVRTSLAQLSIWSVSPACFPYSAFLERYFSAHTAHAHLGLSLCLFVATRVRKAEVAMMRTMQR